MREEIAAQQRDFAERRERVQEKISALQVAGGDINGKDDRGRAAAADSLLSPLLLPNQFLLLNVSTYSKD